MKGKVNMNPACAVCTVMVGASLGIARKLGVDDTIIAVWFGALMALGGYWLIKWFDKKNWNFKFRNKVLMALSLSTVIPMYFGMLTYTPQKYLLYLDKFLAVYLLGALVIPLTSKLYQYMKAKNGGHAHFPFEKVVIPVLTLTLISLILHFIAK